MELVKLNKKEFAEFARKNPQYSFMQSTEHGDLKEEMGNIVHYLALKKAGKILAATLIVESKLFFKYKSFYAARGFLLDYHDEELLNAFVLKLREYAKSQNAIRVIIDPNVIYRVRANDGEVIPEKEEDIKSVENLKKAGFKHFGFNDFTQSIQSRWAVILELSKDYESLKQSFSKSTKKNIDNCYKKGLVVRKGNEKDLEVMAKLFSNTATKKKFFHRDYEYYKLMYKNMKSLMTIYFAYLDPDNYLKASTEALENELKNMKEIKEKMKGSVVGKKLNQQLKQSESAIEKHENEIVKAVEFKEKHPKGLDIACLLSLESGNEYLTLSSGSLEEYHRFTPKYAMYDAHIKDALKNNYKYCNFYGISGNFSKENNPHYGIFEFKRGFNGEVIEYIGQFTLEINKINRLYELLIKLKDKIKR